MPSTAVSPGRLVRRVLPSRIERWAAEAYRSWYVDLDSLGAAIATRAPMTSVIEVGCGEGALANRLAPTASESFLGIDITQGVGRNFTGNPARCTFRTCEVAALVAEGASAETVVVSDVIHHVPVAERVDFIAGVGRLRRSGGTLVVKEWERLGNLAHQFASFSDKYLTGDRHVQFLRRDELEALVGTACPGLSVVDEVRIAPRRNNLLMIFREG